MKTTNIFSTALTPAENTSITPNPAHKIRKIHRFLSRGTLTLNDLILNYCHLEGSKTLLLLALQEKENVLKRCLWKTPFRHTAKKPHSLPRKHPCDPLRKVGQFAFSIFRTVSSSDSRNFERSRLEKGFGPPPPASERVPSPRSASSRSR